MLVFFFPIQKPPKRAHHPMNGLGEETLAKNTDLLIAFFFSCHFIKAQMVICMCHRYQALAARSLWP